MRDIFFFLALGVFLVTGNVVVANTHGVDDYADRIVFHSVVCVPGAQVRLGDLAVGTGPESSVYLEHFGTLQVADAPSKKGQRIIVTERMIHRVLATAGAVPAGSRIPNQIVVQRGGRVVTAREIHSLADKFLTSAVASFQGEVVIRKYKLPEYVFIPDEKGRLSIDASRTIEPGRVSFRFAVEDRDHKILRRITASAFVDVWITAPCASRPLNRGARLGPAVVRFERKNLAYLRGRVWNGRGGRWRVVRPLGAGSVVYDKSIELLPDIVEGARVSLVFEGPTIRLEVPAVAIGEGHIGSSIMVRNLQSNKKILARIEDGDTVIVH